MKNEVKPEDLNRQFELAVKEIAAMPKWRRDMIRESAKRSRGEP